MQIVNPQVNKNENWTNEFNKHISANMNKQQSQPQSQIAKEPFQQYQQSRVYQPMFMTSAFMQPSQQNSMDKFNKIFESIGDKKRGKRIFEARA